MKQKNSKLKNKTGYKRLVMKTIASPVLYMIIITLLAVTIEVLKPEAIGFVMVVMIAMICYTIFAIYAELKLKNKKLAEMHYSFKNAIGKNIKHLDVPVMFISTDAKLIWENALSNELGLSTFVEEVSIEANKVNKKEEIKFAANNKNYTLHITDMLFEDNVGKLVLFVDVSEKYELEKILDDTRTVVGVITIDSYDEIMQGLDELDKVNTISGIDTELVAWVKQYDGIVAK